MAFRRARRSKLRNFANGWVFSRAAYLICELNGFLFLAFGRKLFRNLLRHSFNGCCNFRRNLLAQAEPIALDPIDCNPLRQAIQSLAKSKRFRHAEPMAGEVLRARKVGRTAFPNMYRAHRSTSHNRVNQDDLLVALPTRYEFEGPTTLNLSRNAEFTQALRNYNSSAVIHTLRVPAPDDSSLHVYVGRTPLSASPFLAIVSFRKWVAQEMHGS